MKTNQSLSKTKQKALPISEHEIQSLIIQYLKLKGWFVLRLNSGIIPVYGVGGKRRAIRMGEAGTPDLLAFQGCGCCVAHMSCDLVFIEVKRPGGKPTALQTDKMAELERFGAKCIVATSVDELEERLKNV